MFFSPDFNFHLCFLAVIRFTERHRLITRIIPLNSLKPPKHCLHSTCVAKAGNVMSLYQCQTVFFLAFPQVKEFGFSTSEGIWLFHKWRNLAFANLTFNQNEYCVSEMRFQADFFSGKLTPKALISLVNRTSASPVIMQNAKFIKKNEVSREERMFLNCKRPNNYAENAQRRESRQHCDLKTKTVHVQCASGVCRTCVSACVSLSICWCLFASPRARIIWLGRWRSHPKHTQLQQSRALCQNLYSSWVGNRGCHIYLSGYSPAGL
jgi:hypothetical protein